MLAKKRIRWSCARAALLLSIATLLLAIPAGHVSANAFSAPAQAIAGAVAATPATSIAVNTTADVVDGDVASFDALLTQPGPDGKIALREAITASNAMSGTSALAITFNIPAGDPGYSSADKTWTIALANANPPLPPLVRGHVMIDGASQPGDPGRPQIVLDGYDTYGDVDLVNGITLESPANVVRGLALMNFYDSTVRIDGANASENIVSGCYLGTDAHGAMPALQSTQGVKISGGASGNTVGGGTTAARNLISAAFTFGVQIEGATTHGNIVAGNFIGVSSNGTAALPNGFAGIKISGGAYENVIGGANQGNIISGNGSYGIYLETTSGNTIAGNMIGLAADQHTPLGNVNGGILAIAGANNNIIGGTTAAARNVISGNGSGASEYGQGVYLSGLNTSNNVIQGNYIGVDAGGNLPAGNLRQGVLIAGDANNNVVGGTAAGAGNVIAYNGMGGVWIDAQNNQIAGNLIGVGADGSTALGNQFNGVRVADNGNMLGPDNVIANNQRAGVLLDRGTTIVLSNTLDLNGSAGICVIGSGSTITGNSIEENGVSAGPWADCGTRGGIVTKGVTNTQIIDNRILGNADSGVTIDGGSGVSLLANSISGNSGAGIRLTQGANNAIKPPQLDQLHGTMVSGTACAGCRVEIFNDPANQGRYFVGRTTAGANSTFSLQLAPGDLNDAYITATLTDNNGNTSSFAAAISRNGPAPDPTPKPTEPPGRSLKVFAPLVTR